MLHEGHKVLYKQLLAWILQGSLFDPYEEFFIGEDNSVSGVDGAGNPLEESSTLQTSTNASSSNTFSSTFSVQSQPGSKKKQNYRYSEH